MLSLANIYVRVGVCLQTDFLPFSTQSVQRQTTTTFYTKKTK